MKIPLLHRLAAWWHRPTEPSPAPAVETAPIEPTPAPAYPPLPDPAMYGRLVDADDKQPEREWGGPGARESRGDLLFYTPPGAWKHTPTRARKRKGAKR